MNTVKIRAGKTRMIAHRGMSGLECENTAAAFVAAGNRTYFGIETDVRLTGDGEFILSHDDSTLRTSGAEHIISASRFDELREVRLLDKGGDGVRHDLVLATPREYFAICRKYEKQAVLEIKGTMQREALSRLVGEIRECGWLARTTFISFGFENLVILRELCPENEIQYLVDHIDDPRAFIACLTAHHFDLDIHHKALSREVLDLCHAAGISVNAWTVDGPKRAEELVSMGIDFITSNILEGENSPEG